MSVETEFTAELDVQLQVRDRTGATIRGMSGPVPLRKRVVLDAISTEDFQVELYIEQINVRGWVR